MLLFNDREDLFVSGLQEVSPENTGHPNPDKPKHRSVNQDDRLQKAMRLVVETTASTTDEDFFKALVENLAEATGVMAAMVTELVPTRKFVVRTKALCIRGKIHSNIQYSVLGRPCEDVIKKGKMIVHPEHVQVLFPKDDHLVDLEAESFIGIPYFGTDRKLLGHLILLDDKPLGDIEFLITLSKLFATRAGVELERSQTLEALRYRVEMEKLLAEISTNFINVSPDKLDSAINQALGLIGSFAEVDRSYVFLFSDDGKTYANTHEWCAEGVESRIRSLQNLRIDDLNWMLNSLRRNEVIHIPRLAELPTEAEEVKESLQSRGVCSLLEVPIASGHQLIGILGFNTGRCEKEWSEEDIRMLRLVGEMLANALERSRAERELKNAQGQLIQSERMAVLGKLTAGIAHEVNNPVGALKSTADVSERCIQKIAASLEENETDSEAVKKSLKILKDNIRVVTSASDRIAELVTSLKRFARLDGAEFQKVDLHEGIEGALTLLQHELHDRIDVIRDYGDLPQICCFPSELHQAFMHVLTNAIQAIEDKGIITITTSANESTVRIEISDTGKGISPEKLQRLFDFDFTTKSSRVGIGVGLFSTYNIVQKHKGEIRVKSEVGKGTTVVMTLRNDLERFFST
ncbi:GAF domain-containing protein [candidate division KSB1 bacterium]|nr:GAF domain-containing protein [candidate division KSB1 bacterium]NIR71756.1 GAF domain-containing protein [candidate division KSB1 bacterium]NIS24912.1 GAF domain-containing protein [candidate division KSB1 bacterium]NIT71788.1 GAF domain-containing protein [candidate division KSB1 bacterium]NIU25526.1 GAF domain-containing protein [candidate division KSB1 bacterium]